MGWQRIQSLIELILIDIFFFRKSSGDGVYVGRQGEMMINTLEHQECNKNANSDIANFVESELKLLADQAIIESCLVRIYVSIKWYL